MNFLVLGINHHDTSKEIRQKYAFDAETIDQVLSALKSKIECHASIVILSTCNRLELYSHGITEECALTCWDILTTWTGAKHITPAVQKKNVACFEHLLNVALGLKSQILKEYHITGQIKAAYKQSDRIGCLKHPLRRLFEHIAHFSKDIRSSWTDKPSLGRLVIQHLKDFLNIHTQKILIIGAGALAKDLITYCPARWHHNISIANRTLERAKTLISNKPICYMSLDALETCITKFDVIIFAIPSEIPWISSIIADSKRFTLIDLSMPSSINTSVQTAENIKYYDLDDFVYTSSHDSHYLEHNYRNLKNTLQDLVELMNFEQKRFMLKEYRLKMEAIYNTVVERTLSRSLQKDPSLESVKQTVYQLKQKLLHASSVALRQNLLISGDYSLHISPYAQPSVTSESFESLPTS
ncbi:MAG: hypothetical protein FJ161_01270 [Gammaproteobacteria bacterium]|nr:hypothetical protein [Gammaproteobacteria bacterium]